MQTVALICLTSAILASMAVGIRLLARARQLRALPECLLGIAFLGTGIGHGLSELGRRVLWPDPSLFATTMNTALFACAVAGTIALYAALWRVFRTDIIAGSLTFWVCSTLTCVALVIRFVHGDFETGNVYHGPGMKLYMLMRMSVFCWAAVEGFNHYRLLKKRLAIGIGSPVGLFQMRMWGAAGIFGMGMTFTTGYCYTTLYRDPLDSPLTTGLLIVFTVGTILAVWSAFFPSSALKQRLIEGEPLVNTAA